MLFLKTQDADVFDAFYKQDPVVWKWSAIVFIYRCNA